MDVKIGQITHYYTRIGVAVVSLEGELKVGDGILILGHTTDFMQMVRSMEVNHEPIQAAGPGDVIALKVWDAVRRGDLVYRVPERQAVESAGLEPTAYAG